ncbi:hypothetical protein ABU162_04585 [Paenibacillus thiaminolyticus]|uniref:hypothetical protein n=1 Tax=Paenibacillus thiaminolyticus TaxID=49283 RepID=UPI0035A58E1F
MQASTDMLVRQHVAYLNSLIEPRVEMDKFETLYDHMFYYFHDVLSIPAHEAAAVVTDFYADAMRA